MSLIGKTARKYQKRGFSVIPLKSKGKEALVDWKEYQTNKATAAQIRSWWRQWPDANVGIITGKLSGLVVLDADGEEALNDLQELLAEYKFSKVPTVQTARGWHFYFKHPGVAIKSRAGVRPKLDVRGDGGYIVAPPSMHESGEEYIWIGPLRKQLPEIPPKLLELIAPDSNENGPSIREAVDMPRLLAGVPKGQRNERLFRAACKLRGADVPLEFAEKLISEAANNCDPPYDERDPIELVRQVYEKYPPESTIPESQNPWDNAKPAPFFLAQKEKQFQGIVQDLLSPGAVTLISAPRGLGKTHVAHALAVSLARGERFRGEKMVPTKVLILDRDNPEAVIRERLRSWGADDTKNLHVLTRSNVPSLRNKTAWELFPTDQFSVVIIDALNSFTEGVTEKEGKETTQVLATLLDLARKGVAILILHNTTKDGANMRGRGEVSDRVDIIYEVRDATGFAPSGEKAWWEELPESGEKTFISRATRRKGRTDYRLAFIPSKFRLAREPEPFCLEIHLPKDEPWVLKDVTHELLESGEEAMERTRREKEEQMKNAADVLKAEIVKRKSQGTLLLKSEAEKLLQAEGRLKQAEARKLIEEKTGILWIQEKQPGGRRKGKPIALLLSGKGDLYISTTKKQTNKVRSITTGRQTSISSHAQSKKRLSA
jgi:hypothetical protein